MQEEYYRKIQTMFNLPDFDELRKVFKISCDCENEVLFIEHLRTEITDQLFELAEKVIEPVVTHSDSFATTVEHNMLTKKDKKELFELYKKIQSLKWENTLLNLNLEHNEEKTAKYIKKAWEIWNNDIKTTISRISKQLSKNWRELKFKKEKIDYSS